MRLRLLLRAATTFLVVFDELQPILTGDPIDNPRSHPRVRQGNESDG